MITFQVKEYECMIDDCDADLLDWRWYLKKDDCATYVRGVDPKTKKLRGIHRIIMERMLARELDRKEDIDHRDRNGLNNTRANLRLATRSQNNANTKLRKQNKVGFKGVFKARKKFAAQIGVSGVQIHLGTFDTPELAHAAYLEAAKKYYGDFARGE